MNDKQFEILIATINEQNHWLRRVCENQDEQTERLNLAVEKLDALVLCLGPDNDIEGGAES